MKTRARELYQKLIFEIDDNTDLTKEIITLLEQRLKQKEGKKKYYGM